MTSFRIFLMALALSIFTMSACGDEAPAEAEQTPAAGITEPSEGAAEYSGHIFQGYIALKDAMVAGEENTVQLNARILSDLIGDMGPGNMRDDEQELYAQLSSEISEKAMKIYASDGIDMQREHFSEMADPMVKLMESMTTHEKTVYYQYCPMAFDKKGAYWLSNDTSIVNPYYGSMMLNCGKVVREI